MARPGTVALIMFIANDTFSLSFENENFRSYPENEDILWRLSNAVS